MKHEDSFRLMELMMEMGLKSDLIMLTLNYCAYGQSIGPAFIEALHVLNEQMDKSCKTDTLK